MSMSLLPGDFCVGRRGEWISAYAVSNRSTWAGTMKANDVVLVISISVVSVGECDVVVLHSKMGIVQCSSYLLEKI